MVHKLLDDSREIDAADVTSLSYVELISLLRETNRPPGGKHALARIARCVGLSREASVLEIGSNTGFTSIELAKLCGCRCHGIDPVPAAVAEAQRRAALHPWPIPGLVTFAVGDASRIDAPDASYDLVVCGGANSFIDEAKRPLALAEYRRVLRPYGFLSVTNLFYAAPPPDELVAEVSLTIGTPLVPRNLDDWLRVFHRPGWELFDLQTWRLAARPPAVVDAYVDSLLQQKHLQTLSQSARKALRERWAGAMRVFNENHRYLGAMMLLLRPSLDRLAEQPELFLEPGRYDPFFELGFVGRSEA